MIHDDYATVLRLIDSRLSLPIIYAKLRDILRSRMPASNMYVCIVEPEGLRFPYYVDEQFIENPLKLYPRNGWTGYVIDTRKTFWLSRDGGIADLPAPIGPSPLDWIGTPFFDRDGAALGVLALQTYAKGEAFSVADTEFIEYCACAVSLAIQFARLERELVIRRIAALVEETVEIADLYPKIHEAMETIIPAARKNIIIARVDAAAGVFRPVYWRDEKDDFDEWHWPLDHGFGGYIYGVTGESFIYEDGQTAVPEEVVPIGFPPRYWLGSPLFNRDTIIGIVIIQSYDSSEVITKEDQYALDGICPYIASAIRHTEMFKRLIQ